MATESEIRKALKQGLEESRRHVSLVLWPEPYAQATADSACQFIFEKVETLEETQKSAMRVPELAYLRKFAESWYECKENKIPLVIEKSRRLICSWFATALEVHYCGVQSASVMVAARTYKGMGGSCQFVFRHHYIYDRLRFNNPQWGLEPGTPMGSIDNEELDSFRFPNGSTVKAINAEGETFRGGGGSIVRIEELSQRNNVAQLWGQALATTMGPAGMAGGFVYTLNNASPNMEWRQLLGRV